MQATNSHPPASTEAVEQASRLVLKLAVALHHAGTPAHRLEGLCDVVAHKLGVEVRVFSLPTALFVAVGPEHQARTELLKVAPGAPDIGRQADLDALTEALLDESTSPAEASLALDAFDEEPPRWSMLATVLAFGLTGSTAAIVLGGGPAESLVSTVAGLLVGAIALFVGPRPSLTSVFEPIATFVAMGLAVAVHHLLMPIDVVSVTLAAVIVLLPGLSLTTSFVELATRNLVSGTARLAGAMIVFVGMAVGAALASRAGGMLPPVAEADPGSVPDVVRWAILPVVGLMLAVLLRARPRDLLWCALAPVVAVGIDTAGTAVLGTVLGTGAAGFGLTVVSNVVSRLRRRPAATLLVPGILLLVPGSAGLRAILALAEHDVLVGVDGLFAAILVATSLAAGVLLANVVVRPRRAL